MKCLLCRIKNQHTELMRHTNDTTFNSLESLWRTLKESLVEPAKHDKEYSSIASCVIHQTEIGRDLWFDEMEPKMKLLETKGVVVKRRRRE